MTAFFTQPLIDRAVSWCGRILPAGLLAASLGAATVSAQTPDKHPAAEELSKAGITVESVMNRLEQVADWQVKTAGAPSEWPIDWRWGALYTGLAALDELKAERTYHDALMKMAKSRNWQPGRKKYHADHHCVSQVYLYLYQQHGENAMLEPTRAVFDNVLRHYESEGNSTKWLWHWCDALYMAPPAFVHLSYLLQEPKYRKFANREWWKTSEALYDKEAHLYYRDKRPIGRKGPGGNKIFWSRGNGWVFGGLARMLRYLPANDPMYDQYVTQFKEMAHALRKLQKDDGLWGSSLLSPEHYQSDSSGSGFFVYGFAWGVNQGLLDAETFLPVIENGWEGLAACITESGKFTHVQPVGRRPATFNPQHSDVYGVGAFLLAGSEVCRLAGGTRFDKGKTSLTDSSSEHNGADNRTQDTPSTPEVTTFMKNGGWCWFQDPRALLHDDKLIIGGVQGHGPGSAVVGVYSLQKDQSLGQTVLHERFDGDDHNTPSFYLRPDNRLLAVYARHNREKRNYYRISEANDFLSWGEEQVYRHDYPRAGGVTYMNLVPVPAEDKLYDFYRGINFNPCFITSTDQGQTWGAPTHFIKDEANGRQRPYARYVGNHEDTVHVCFTDGHPRQLNNNIYYAAYRDGNFYKANGELIKNLSKDGPLRPSEADKVFDHNLYNEQARGWTSSIVLDAQGHPHLGYSVHLSNDDHRYRMAYWNGNKWIDREVAYAGKCLYTRENDYTGLITLDPGNPRYAVISTDVHPKTGEQLGRHEIFRARIDPRDDINSIEWQPLTRNSDVRNIRPMILRDDTRRVIMWLRGRYDSYTDYDLDVVGIAVPLGQK